VGELVVPLLEALMGVVEAATEGLDLIVAEVVHRRSFGSGSRAGEGARGGVDSDPRRRRG
jgi:hypothetical protein